MRFTSVLPVVILAVMLTVAATCTKESFVPSSVGEKGAKSPLGPSESVTDSLSAPVDSGRIYSSDVDTTKGGTTPAGSIYPEAVLANLTVAYKLRDIGLLASCLAPDFRFYPGRYAPGQDPGATDAAWGREQEIAIHRNVFDPDFRAEAPFCGADFISAIFTVIAEEPYGDPGQDRWKLRCNAVFTIWNTQASRKPFAVTQEGASYFIVRPDSQNVDRWLIEAWWEGVGRRRFLYTP